MLRLVALIGGLLTSLGYILSWASFQQHISSNYWLIIFWQLLLCHGMAWLDTATICTAIINLPGHEGAVSGKALHVAAVDLRSFESKCLHVWDIRRCDELEEVEHINMRAHASHESVKTKSVIIVDCNCVV